MTVARIILQPDSDAGRRCECREGAGVNLEGGGRWASPRNAAESVGSVGGGGWGGRAAAVSRRNDAFVEGQEVVEQVVDAEVVQLKGELV